MKNGWGSPSTLSPWQRRDVLLSILPKKLLILSAAPPGGWRRRQPNWFCCRFNFLSDFISDSLLEFHRRRAENWQESFSGSAGRWIMEFEETWHTFLWLCWVQNKTGSWQTARCRLDTTLKINFLRKPPVFLSRKINLINTSTDPTLCQFMKSGQNRCSRNLHRTIWPVGATKIGCKKIQYGKTMDLK